MFVREEKNVSSNIIQFFWLVFVHVCDLGDLHETN